MKRAILTITVISILLASCQSANSAGSDTTTVVKETASATEETHAESRMLDDLAEYICQCETIYSDIQWVIASFEEFDKEKTWENLETARARLFVARREIASLSFSQPKMTREDQKELMDRGIDVSFLETANEDFEDERTTLLNSSMNLYYGVMDDVLLQNDWEVCMRRAAVLKEQTDLYMQYNANLADWVLASLNDDETTGEFYSVMASRCPMTHACQAEVLEDPESVEKKRALLYDQIESLNLERAELIGAHDDNWRDMKELLEKGDYAAIGENIMEISGLPATIVYPAWYVDEDIYYYWVENGEALDLPTTKTMPDRIPDGCQIKVSNVTKEEMLEYQEELESHGITSLRSTEKDGKLSIYYEYGGSTFTLSWEEDTATIFMIENPVCLVPRWYPEALEAVSGT